MTLTRGFVRNAVTTPLDARLMDMAQVVCNNDGTPRTGVLWSGQTVVVGALATMNVAVFANEYVASKGKADGVTIFTNDGTVNVAIAAAPATNSRIDVIWVRHQDSTTGDGASTPIFGVTAGTAAASPTKPSIPTGALELATLRVYAGTTATNGGSNTLTQTAQYTAMRGGVVPVRTLSEQESWTTPVLGQQIYRLDTGHSLYRGFGMWVIAAHTNAYARQMAGTNTFTNQTSNGDFPNAPDAAALAGTFVKSSFSSKLIVSAYATAQLSAGIAQAGVLVVSIGGVDYDVARMQFPVAANRQSLSGTIEIPLGAVAAGSHAVKVRFRAGTASSFEFFTDDRVSYSITETM